MHSSVRTNRLINETSLYLRQHAHNPVDWYPWCHEALEQARRDNKPILLSIGYSACHWCHVMAHESFEDDETAGVMNELFINIKVDREERPDVDRIYQNAFQVLNRRGGGWPLTMFLTPDDQVPFLGVTYVPNEPRFGMPSFMDLMQRVNAFYRAHEGQIRNQNESLLQALQASNRPRQARTGYSLHPAPLQEAREQLARNYDPVHGGFSQAPKFPQPTSIERLLHHWSHSVANNTPDREARTMACSTLRKMALGGIYDQLRGGFCRYSVDNKWLIPHFEKMLYDNGLLLTLYSEAWQATKDPLFKKVCEETGTWVMDEMQSPEGGYYSTLDADSEGEEGKYYLWTLDETKNLLTTDELDVFAPRFGLDRDANFEGHWHLHVCSEISEISSRLGIEQSTVATRLATACNRLLATREQRVRPRRDEKILTAWNGLMIKGMAAAGRRLGRADFVASAQASLDFISSHLRCDGRLLATYKDGKAYLTAYLDDYAFLIDGIIELLQARWRSEDMSFALELAEVLLKHYQDAGRGGFYFTSDDHETLIHRPKPIYDEALPAGNGVASQVLLKLGHLLSSMKYLVAAERTLKWSWPAIEQTPMACNALLLALEEYFYPSQTVIVRSHDFSELDIWRQRCTYAYAPHRLVFTIPTDAANLPNALAIKTGGTEKTAAYICSGTRCSAAVTRPKELDALLSESKKPTTN